MEVKFKKNRSLPPRNAPFSGRFLVLYLSIMIVVVSVMVCRINLSRKQLQLPAASARTENPIFRETFALNQGEFSQRFEALVSLLLAHDVRAEIVIKQESLLAGLYQAENLYQKFIDLQVPANAISVRAAQSDQTNGEQAYEVRLYD